MELIIKTHLKESLFRIAPYKFSLKNTLSSCMCVMSCSILLFIQGCRKDSDSPQQLSFKMTQDIIEIPFEYKNNYISTKVIVGADTIDFIVDTGSPLTFIPHLNGNKDSDTTMQAIDAVGIAKNVSIVLTKSMKWGNLSIQNLRCGVNEKDKEYGIIGGDILRNFYVQINNAENKIILSKNQQIITNNRLFKVPFQLNKDSSIFVTGDLGTDSPKTSGEFKYNFLFDTGCSYEIVLHKTARLPFTKEKQKWEISYNSAFCKENTISDATFFLTDFNLGDGLFHNVIGGYVERMKYINLIGTIFIRRFESVTIDYKNKMLYFELPKDGKILKFPIANISNTTTSYFGFLCSTIASFGIRFREEAPLVLVVEGIREEWKNLININDILVGVNNTIVNRNAWAFIKKQNSSLQQNSLTFSEDFHAYKPIFLDNKIRFLFLKEEKLVEVNAKRKNHLIPKNFIYSFSEQNKDWAYFGIHINRDSLLNYSLHYPWSSLIEQRIQIKGYQNGKQKVITN